MRSSKCEKPDKLKKPMAEKAADTSQSQTLKQQLVIVPDHSKDLFLILGEFAWSLISTEKGMNILMKEEKMLLEKACAHNTGMGLQGRCT